MAGFNDHSLGLISEAIKRRKDADKFCLSAVSIADADRRQRFYSQQYTSKLLHRVFDEVFYPLSNPRGFCRYENGTCADATPGQRNCGKHQDQKCGKRKPHFIVLLYADDLRSDVLRSDFGKFSYLCAVRRAEFSHDKRSVQTHLDRLITRLEIVSRELMLKVGDSPISMRTPLTLPPRNFKSSDFAISRLIKETWDLNPHFWPLHDRKASDWRTTDDVGHRGFKDGRQLRFVPDHAMHGWASLDGSDSTEKVFCLSTFYRVGVPYSEALHFDVSRENNAPLYVEFQCAKKGTTGMLTSTHVNISPNDVIRA
ncbi:MAG: hypothetical protein KGJ66_07155 [Alphaproteobacteria bacterium]|nr:hypothetical protein [Alphaproteobacteria bacterium]